LERVIGIGEYCVSGDTEDILKIYGLSSCIGLVMYCPDIKVLGLGHFLLPDSGTNKILSGISPAYFVDTGIEAMIEKICLTYGYRKENIEVSVYGGAAAKTSDDIFNIGKRNIIAVKKKIAEHRLKIKYSDIGGRICRTLIVCVEDGEPVLKLQKGLKTEDTPLLQGIK
jgi:chemotaxis protein CheD